MDARLHVEPTPLGPKRAREFVGGALGAWGYEHHSDTAALLVSELVTNAVVHAASPVALRVAVLESTLRVEVGDNSSVLPAATDQPPDEPGGFGLPLVEALADRWGYDSIPDDGKVVWFEIGS